MKDIVSPKYHMNLAEEVVTKIWSNYNSNDKAEFYVQKWQVWEQWDERMLPNFNVSYTNGLLDLDATIHSLDFDLLVKMAIDLGLETPDFIPSIPTFRNEVKSEYPTASATFEKAFKQIESDPSVAIGLANSAFESIIKEIMKDKRVSIKNKKKDTLHTLTCNILKEFSLYPSSDMPEEVKTLGSSLIAACQAIEKMRSEKTEFHGKTEEDYVIDDPLYAYFVVNSLSSVGLLLNSLYKKKMPPVVADSSMDIDDGLPF